MRRDNIEAKGETWSAEEEENFAAPIRAQYESQGNPYYATARLWDDGVIDPADTRAGARPRALGGAQRADRADDASACSGCDDGSPNCTGAFARS